MPGSKANRQKTQKLIEQAQQRQQQRREPLPLHPGLPPQPIPQPASAAATPAQHPVHGLTTEQWVFMQLVQTALGGGSSPEYAAHDALDALDDLKELAGEILAFAGGRA